MADINLKVEYDSHQLFYVAIDSHHLNSKIFGDYFCQKKLFNKFFSFKKLLFGFCVIAIPHLGGIKFIDIWRFFGVLRLYWYSPNCLIGQQLMVFTGKRGNSIGGHAGHQTAMRSSYHEALWRGLTLNPRFPSHTA